MRQKRTFVRQTEKSLSYRMSTFVAKNRKLFYY